MGAQGQRKSGLQDEVGVQGQEPGGHHLSVTILSTVYSFHEGEPHKELGQATEEELGIRTLLKGTQIWF